MDSLPETVARAQQAQSSWASRSIRDRARALIRFRKALVAQVDSLAEAVGRETNKPPHEAVLHEVMALSDNLTWMARNAPRALRARRVPLHLLKHRVSRVSHIPRRVTAVISPYNFPLLIPLSDAGAALVTGSAVIVKPSELAAVALLQAKALWDSIGLDPNLLQVVTGDGKVGAALLDSGVDQVLFTGGVEAGRRVAAACAAKLIPSVLELGGNAPAIVCADANLEQAARAIVFGGCFNAGQACVAVERVYADRAIVTQLVERLTVLVGQLRVGPPSALPDVGALVQPSQVKRIERLIAQATAEGARVTTGGRRHGEEGNYFEPTVVADCTQSMAIVREEIFGPVIPVAAVKDEDEALRLANDSPVGLAAYVFTRNRARGRHLASKLEVGSVGINETILQYATPEAPFGGVKSSGWGRIHGTDALRALTDVRHVSHDRFRGLDARWFWFPYTEAKLRWLRRAATWLFG